MKKLSGIALLFFFCALSMFTLTACHKDKGAYNPYRESKVRPSEKQMREDKKVNKKGNKNYKKQMRSNRKFLFGRSVAPK